MPPHMTRAALLCLCLVLAACQDAPPPPPEEAGGDGARGEVLEGTISDQMLPLDTIMQPGPTPSAAGDDGAATEEEPGVAEQVSAAPDAE